MKLRCLAVLSMLGTLFVLPNGLSGPAPATAAPPAFSITTNPPLDPSFNPAILNYAVRCTGSPTTNVTTTGSGQVTVGGTSLPNPVDVNLPLVGGQGLQITNGATSYFIRCLPSDFPTYSAAVTGQPQQANGYFLTLAHYAVVFDTDGVPVWWYRDGDAFSPFDVKFINPSTIAYSDGFLGTYSLRGLDGTLKLTLGGGSNPLDFHDLQQLPNGNYLGIMDVTRNCPADPTQCVDLSSWGLSSQSTITDNVIVELNPANQIVWQWSVADHINVATANVNWRDQFPDVVHMNSILYDGNGGIIFSARHFDAVYRIDMATGAITWKLGGSTTPQSLNVVGDQYAQLFSGQHFARLQPDGSLTVHDNGTRANRQPCALRFTIDTSTNTATEVEQVTDSRTSTANCCGSATKLHGWGLGHLVGRERFHDRAELAGRPTDHHYLSGFLLPSCRRPGHGRRSPSGHGCHGATADRCSGHQCAVALQWGDAVPIHLAQCLRLERHYRSSSRYSAASTVFGVRYSVRRRRPTSAICATGTPQMFPTARMSNCRGLQLGWEHLELGRQYHRQEPGDPDDERCHPLQWGARGPDRPCLTPPPRTPPASYSRYSVVSTVFGVQ